MGWCYTGAIAAAFQKIGTFKLKVRDKQVCKDCTTLDCAKGCPVGLSSTCPVTSGRRVNSEAPSVAASRDCVEECPYDDLYISDVRHSIRRLLGRPETRPRRALTPRVAARSLRAAPVRAATYEPADGDVLLPMVPARHPHDAPLSVRGGRGFGGPACRRAARERLSEGGSS